MSANLYEAQRLSEQDRARAASSSSSMAVNGVVIWAWVGVLWFALIAYSFTMWLATGQATPTIPVDAEPWRVTLFGYIEIFGYIAAAAVLYLVVVQPKIRTGRFTTNGLVILTCATMWYQDPLINYLVPNGLYSSIFTNWGSWSAHFPGVVAPRLNLVPEPPFQLCVYIFGMSGMVYLVLWAMRRWKARFPHTTNMQLVLVAFVFGMIADFVLELPAIFLQIWAYPGAPRWISLWPDQVHRFPLYEVVILGVFFASLAAILYFRNDRGQLFCERGVERLAVGKRRETGIRFLSMVGLFQTVFFFTYFLPIWMVMLHQAPWPADFPKHLTNGLCGEGTGLMCPGTDVPLFRKTESLVITPDGTLATKPAQQ